MVSTEMIDSVHTTPPMQRPCKAATSGVVKRHSHDQILRRTGNGQLALSQGVAAGTQSHTGGWPRVNVYNEPTGAPTSMVAEDTWQVAAHSDTPQTARQINHIFHTTHTHIHSHWRVLYVHHTVFRNAPPMFPPIPP